MVSSKSARDDVWHELLTKTITYRCFTKETTDLSLDEYSQQENYIDYTIRAQCTVQNVNSRFVRAGRLIEGDLVGLFFYQYEKEENGDAIEPPLIPKSHDKIKFLGQWYNIKECTPATNEDDGIIGWDFTAGQSTSNEYVLGGT